MKDIDIAKKATLKPIGKIAEILGINTDDLDFYGKYKAKLPLSLIDQKKVDANKLILVSAISPTPAGEGKTTMSIGLTQGLNQIGRKTTVVLREPSLGPVFGIKGGATGGGYSQVLPMEDINLHFTGDFSAIEKAHNLLSALIDNNIQSKTRNLGIDPRTILWKRVMDMNDRALRSVIVGLGGTTMGVPRETGFDITAASEIMAILCLSTDLMDLKERLGNIFIGFTYKREPVYARDLNAQGAMTALLKDAIKPNLVQTIEGNPAIIHGGPFANIAQGTNSVIATKMGLTFSDYVVTEAGFGFDLGAEKFLDIKCQSAGLSPSAIVLVATVRSVKYHGGGDLKELTTPNPEAVAAGLGNLEKHLENTRHYGIPAVVGINRFTTDTDEEVQIIIDKCKSMGFTAVVTNVWGEGGKGATDLAEAVAEAVDGCKNKFTPLYDWAAPVKDKIHAVATKVYGAGEVDYSVKAKRDLRRIDKLGLNHLPICIAKTQKSLSDNPKLLGRPKDFTITVREIEIAAGAGFLVPITGSIMRMPGLPSTPSAELIDIDENGNISDYSKSKDPDFRDWFLLIFLAIVWGSSFILMKRGLDSFSPIQVGSLRLAIASVGFAPFIWKAYKNTPKKYYKGIFLMAIFGNALPAFFFAKAQESLYSALAGVLNALTPIFVLIFGLLFFGQKLYGRQSLGVISGFAGAVLLVLADLDDVSAYSLSVFSGGLVVLATISYGLSSNVIKTYLQDLPPMYSGSLAFAMIAPFAFGLLFSTDFITVLEETEGAWYSLGSLTILALVGTVFSSIFYIRLVQRTDAVFSASVTYLIPIVAIIWGVFDKELLKTMHFIGLTVILLGVYLSSKKK